MCSDTGHVLPGEPADGHVQVNCKSCASMMTGLLYTAVQSPCVMIPCLAVISACQHVTLLLLPVLLTVSDGLPDPLVAQTTFFGYVGFAAQRL